MPREMLITLWNIEYSEKNPIKKLNSENSFNHLLIRRITYFMAVLMMKNKINSALFYTPKFEQNQKPFTGILIPIEP